MQPQAAYLVEDNGDLWLTEDEREHMKLSYRIRDVLFDQQSAYQHVMVLDSYDFGPMLVLDGVVQTTSMDGFIYNEMISHVPLNMHPEPRSVLIIGGGDLGAAREVCRYPDVGRVDLVEIDKLVVDACLEYLPDVSGHLKDNRVYYHFTDGVEFAAQCRSDYDVIIVDSSDPVGPAQALFERPFYQSLHNSLKERGIMVCQSQSPLFHRDVLGQAFGAVKELFPVSHLYTAVVPTYPGGLWSFSLGSKHYDRLRPAMLAHGTRYVNRDILHGCFRLPEFLQQFIASL